MNNYIENSFNHLSDDVCDKLAAAAIRGQIIHEF